MRRLGDWGSSTVQLWKIDNWVLIFHLVGSPESISPSRRQPKYTKKKMGEFVSSNLC